MYKPFSRSPLSKHPLSGKSYLAVLAGLSIGATAVLTSCKKDAVDSAATGTTPAATGNLSNLSRAYNESEAAVFVKRAETFQKYADDLRNNLAPDPGGLPANLLPAEAVELLENTTNYYYGRPNQYRPKDSTATFSNAYPSSESGISLKGLAEAYNLFRSQFKGFYEVFGTERSFGYTDFEYNAATNMLVAVADVRYGTVDPRTTGWQGLATEQTFSGYGFYNISWPQSAAYNTACPNNPEAMAAISAYVRQNLGFYNNTSASGPTPTNITSMAVNADSLIAQISTYNYLAQSYPNIKNYNRFFSIPMPYNTPNPNLFVCVDADGMNYYRTAQKQMVLDIQSATGKTCIKYELSERQKPNGRTGVVYAFDYEHQLTTSNFQFANMVYTRMPGETRF